LFCFQIFASNQRVRPAAEAADCETERPTLGDERTERRIRAVRLDAKGMEDGAGNMAGSTSTSPGPAVDVDWTGLAPGTRYLCGVSYRKKAIAASDNLLDFTVVGIDTR
jgi:hypothetical protein